MVEVAKSYIAVFDRKGTDEKCPKSDNTALFSRAVGKDLCLTGAQIETVLASPESETMARLGLSHEEASNAAEYLKSNRTVERRFH